VAIGGGSGPALAARAFGDLLDRVTAVVCTSDTGSSTGVCRKLFDMPAPGDLRATLSAFAALSGSEGWAELWEARLDSPDSEDLHGMALGNLALSALTQRTGDLAGAVRAASELLGIRGKVLPVTAESAHLEAELTDGSIVHGEVAARGLGKPAIARLGWAGSAPQPAEGVLEAIRDADLILMGPGCLYTSILPCLIIAGVADAVRTCRGRSVYCCNTTVTPGQTDGYTVAKHVEKVIAALEWDGLDAVLINSASVDQRIARAYEEMGVVPLEPTAEDIRSISARGIQPIVSPLLADPSPSPRALHKMDTLRHEPTRVRLALDTLLEERR
jgi:uncharacterized cofD-like protein